MKVSRQIIQGVLLNNLVTIVEMGIGFVQQVVLIRFLLGLQQYGTLAFFQAGFGILAMFFNLNLNYSAIRFGGAAQGKDDQDEFYKIQGTTLFLTFLLNLLLTGATLILWRWGFEYKGKIVGEYYVLLALNSLAGLLGGFTATVYTSRKEFRKLSAQQIMGAIVGAISIIFIAYRLPTVKGALYGMIAGSIATSIISLVMVWKDFIHCRVDLTLTRSFGIYGGQFALTSIIKQVFWKADLILLGLFVSEKAVGTYRVAQTVANPLQRVFSPLWTVLFPTVSVESGKGNLENIRKLLFRGTQWLVLGNLPIVIIGSYLLDFVVPRIYGSAAAAVFPIRLLLWGYALGTITCVSPPILRVFRNDLALSSTLAAAILNVLLNLILIPRFGIIGAALASFISFGLLAIFVYYYAFQAIHIKVIPLIDLEVSIQIALITMIMISSILNYFWVSMALFGVLVLYLFSFRIVTVSEFKAYLAS